MKLELRNFEQKPVGGWIDGMGDLKAVLWIAYSNKTRPVWTGFKIAVRLKLLTHYNTRLYTTYKKAKSKYYCFIFR